MKNTIRQTVATIANDNTVTKKEIYFVSPVKPSAANKSLKLEKHVIMTCLIGQEYVDGDGNGSGKSEPLPWGEWESYPYTIQHKGQKYLRITPSDVKPHVSYVVDNTKMTKEEFAAFLTPSNAKKLLESSDPPSCMTIKEENIVHIL